MRPRLASQSISQSTGVMQNANSTWLNDRPLALDLASAVGKPVQIANDANCFALSKAIDGSAKDARIVFGVILGTGVRRWPRHPEEVT